jgi:K+-transporting ATPase KdpF subunit
MDATLVMVNPGTTGTGLSAGYIIGAVIALFIMGYLVYSLVRPEKF